MRDPARRELLYGLNIAREKLLRDDPEAAETAQVYAAYLNLVRIGRNSEGRAMADSKLSVEERILMAVKLTLANVIKDTATPHGMRHPLSDGTIEDLRQCLALISARERELAEAAGRPKGGHPLFTDEPPPGEKKR